MTTARAQHTAGPQPDGRIFMDCGCWVNTLMQYRCPLHTSAPALLAALEAALEIHTHTMDAGGDNWPACNGCGNDQSRGTSHHPQCWVLIARAAIRQARGDD